MQPRGGRPTRAVTLTAGMTPAPAEIKEARLAAGLSQSAAAAMIHSTLRTWQDWEAGVARMHPGLWELFCLKTGAAHEQSP